MRKSNPFLSNSALALIVLSVSDILYFLLIPDTVSALICAMISTIPSLLLMKKKSDEIEKIKKKESSLSFLSAFFLGLLNGEGAKESFDLASRYLVGYQKVMTYEEICQENTIPYGLEEYGQYLSYALEKDQQNEAHLPNYTLVRDEVNRSFRSIEDNMNECLERDKREQILILLCLFGFAIFLAVFPSALDFLDNNTYLISSCITLGMLLPLNTYLSLNNLTRRNENER